MPRRLRALRLLHPFPSFLNASLVALIAWVADAGLATVALLALAMLGMQFAIGVTNDIVDQELDARAKPWKPIPAGLVSQRTATAIALATGVIGLVLALLAGSIEALLWSGMLACGLAYDLRLKPTPWAWACFSIAFALLPIYAWYGAAAAMPPQWPFLITLAVLAGPALQLANGLVDLETDEAAGLQTLAVRLGRRGVLITMAVLLAVIHVAAWLTLAPLGGAVGFVYLTTASGVAAISLWLSSGAPAARRIGWTGQALAVAILAAAWFVVAA